MNKVTLWLLNSLCFWYGKVIEHISLPQMTKRNIATIWIIIRDSRLSDVIAIELAIEEMRVDHRVYNLPWLYILKCIVELEECIPTTPTFLPYHFKVI